MEVLTKLLHIAFVAFWLAGTLYLPQLFRQCRAAADGADHEHLLNLARGLYFTIMTPSAILAVILGSGLIAFGFEGGWLPVKLSLVLLLVLFHLYCGRVLLLFENGERGHRPAYYGLLSTLPVPLLLGIVTLAVAKPF